MLKKIKLVAVDIDGTLTRKRGDVLLSIEAIEAIRALEDNGIVTSLISGNSLPVTAGLAGYIGSSGPALGENGCIALYRGELIHLCSGKPGREVVERLKPLGFRETWQNSFRVHEIALMHPKPTREVLARAFSIVEEMGYRALWSGYAIHIQPPGLGKGKALEKIAVMLGLSMDEVAAVGDGENDVEMLSVAGFSATPSDAADEAKRVASYVASEPGGHGFREIASLILGRGNSYYL